MLRDYITFDVCRAVSRGLYAQHRTMYALLTAVQIGVSMPDWISKDEADAFLKLPDMCDAPTPAAACGTVVALQW